MFKDVGASEDDARLLANWLRLYAQWVRTGERGAAFGSVGELRSQGERVTDGPTALWRGIILDKLERLIMRVGPQAVEQTSTTAAPEKNAVASTPLR